MQNKIVGGSQFTLNALPVLKPEKPNFKNYHALNPKTIASPLLVKYNPGSKYLESTFQRPVTNHEYRQCIRFIGLCIAILRVEYILADFTKMGNPTLEDQQNSEDFLNKALKKTTLIRSARVLAGDASQQQVYDAVVQGSPVLPFQVQAFTSPEVAREWIFQKPFPMNRHKCHSILIPMYCSLKDLKLFAKAEAAKEASYNISTTTDVPAITRCHADFVELKFDRQKSLLQLRWLRRVTSREYRYGILKTGRLVIEHQVKSVLINNHNLGVLTLEDQSWLVVTTSAILTRSCVEKMAVVSSADVMQQMATESINRRIKQIYQDYPAQYFLTEGEAMNWLQLITGA